VNQENQIKNEIILTGRIYPAIQNCVHNRYKIIAGYIAIIGFIVVADGILDAIGNARALWILPTAFSVFVVLNSCNYYYNTRDQIELEDISGNSVLFECWIDIAFSIVMLVFIWLLYYFLGVIQCSS